MERNMEFKSFYKVVGGNEGTKCHYPARLDLYGCGCEHDCSYCYAKSLLSFRKLWNPQDPSVADINKIKKQIDKIANGECGTIKAIRLGRNDRLFSTNRNDTQAHLRNNQVFKPKRSSLFDCDQKRLGRNGRIHEHLK